MDIIKICCSVYKKTDRKETVYVATHMVDQEIWKNFYIWNMIYEYKYNRAQERIK